MNEPDYRLVVAKHFPEYKFLRAGRLTGGVSAEVFKLEMQKGSQVRHVVLRIHGPRHSGHPAELEFELLAALHRSGVLVAKPLAVDISGDVISEHFLLMAYVEGSTRISTGEESTAIVLMAKALARLHKEVTTDFPELPKRTEPLPELFEFFPAGEEWQELKRFLERYDHPFQDKEALLHGDFWPENIMWQQSRIAAILDWEDSAVGDRMSDVATGFLELRYVHGLAGSEKFLSEYRRHHEVDHARFQLWLIYVSAAVQRYMDGWGLPADKEAQMRSTAASMFAEAAAALMGPDA